MKEVINEMFKETGFDKLTWKKRVLFFWCVLAFCLMLCCNYDESRWYALPILLGNFGISVFMVNKFIPKDFWNNIIDDEEF